MRSVSESGKYRGHGLVIHGLLLTMAIVIPAGTMAQETPTAPNARDEDNASRAETAQEPEAEQDSDRILEDYEASEQISEDLSVSFPVDI